ncbi:MAG TPA: sigma-70 family RNA polymerase sigma factor [Planctomycetota bacterium]|nr:sigma-70 family RNA polymerase sigma factor [Planctomycetota bacterium]
MTTPLPLEPAELLHHDRWLRALARSLVCGADVEDLVQDTWAAACAVRPDPVRPLRGWLATVVRRLAARSHRSRTRRLAREATLEPPEDLPSTEATVAVLELQRAVSAAVAAMPEPSRSTILLCYYHERPAAEVAAHFKISEVALRKRLERALRELRSRLRDSRGAEWHRSPAAIALAGVRRLAGFSAVPGAILMHKFVTTAAAVLLLALLAAGGIWWNSAATAEGSEVPRVEAVATAALPARDAAPAAADAPPTEATRVQVPAAPTVEAPQWQGTVVDPSGKPLGGVPLVSVQRLPEVRSTEDNSLLDRMPPELRHLTSELARDSDAVDLANAPKVGTAALDGTFALDAKASTFLLAGPGWATLRAPLLVAERAAGIVVVASPAVRFAGEIVSDLGRPIAGVRIEVRMPPLTDFPFVLDHTRPNPHPVLHTREDGTFALECLPRGTGAIEFHCDGFTPKHVAVPATSLEHERIVLSAVGKSHMVVSGRLLDEREAPIQGGTVGLAAVVVRTDREGRFELVFPRREDGPFKDSRLFAACVGFQSIVIDDFGVRLADPKLREDLVLRLQAPLTTTGRVVDAAGVPQVGALVYPWGEPHVLADRTADELGMPEQAPVQDLGPSVRLWARTDSNGAFELRGLRARDYQLRVWLEQPRVGVTCGPVTAGSRDVELRLPAQLVHERIAGQVVGLDGTPLAGVRVTAPLLRYKTHDGLYSTKGPEATTDAEGRFELRDVPRTDVWLNYNSDAILHGRVELDPNRLFEQRLVAERRCHMRVQVDAGRGAKAFDVLDSNGKGVNINEITPNGSYSTNRWKLEGGRSAVLSVSERAATIVFHGEKGEVGRLPLRLVPGDVAVIVF